MDAQGVILNPNMIEEGESSTPKTFDEFLKVPGVVSSIDETQIPIIEDESVNSSIETKSQETIKPAFTFDENGTPIFNRSSSGQIKNVGISQGGVLFNNNSTNL